VLDGVKTESGQVPRSGDDLAKLSTLVKSAAGASDARGDVVTVESIPFVATDPEPAPPAPPSVLAARVETARRWAPYALGALLALTFSIAVLKRRPAVRADDAPAQLAASDTPAALDGVLQPMLDSGDLRARAHARASQDPATAALVLRFWLGTSAPDSHGTSRS
jgi:flagellar M-ring protein FliF